MTKDRPTFIKQAKGGKIGKLVVKNSTMIGGGDFMDLAGEVENAEIDNNRHIAPPKLKTLVAAIKKPMANGKHGLKVIVGMILIPIIAGIIVHEYGLWRVAPNTIPSQEQPQEQAPKSTGIQK